MGIYENTPYKLHLFEADLDLDPATKYPEWFERADARIRQALDDLRDRGHDPPRILEITADESIHELGPVIGVFDFATLTVEKWAEEMGKKIFIKDGMAEIWVKLIN